ncbi:MAG: DUF1015 family protein [Sporichthyaceae bacterium]
MPQFSPFPGIRYASDALDEVTAPPYDVIDAVERAGLCARHEHNVVRIDMPVAEDGPDPYALAAQRFGQWLADGVLTVDGPALYPYRMTAADESGVLRQTLGVLGALGIDSVARADVLPHERTTPKAHSDRLALLEATRANFSAIWGLSLTSGLTELLDLDSATVLGAWDDEDGITHELWRLDDPVAVKAVCEAVGSAPLVIADGHHRYSTCLTYYDGLGSPAGAAATMCLVVELQHDQLTVQPIHRLLAGLPEGTDLASLLSVDFAVGELEPLPEPTIVDRLVSERALALLTADGLRLLRPLRDTEGVEPLDSVRVAEAAATLPSHELTYQHGVGHALAAVRSGRAQAAILLRPVSVEQIRATAEARGLMPPKSTFFWPKPRTGTVFRSLT